MIKKRVCILYFLFLLCAGFISARIYIIATNGSQASAVLSGQYSRKSEIASRPGFVFDRNNKPLNVSQNGYIIYVNPALLKQSEINDAAKALSEVSQTQSYHVQKLLSGIPYTFSSSKRLDAEFCKSFEKYEKTQGSFLCHVLGYENSDGKGVSGVLGAYSDFLSDTEYTASKVFARYQADASGKSFSDTSCEIFVSDYKKKEGVFLTIDYDIQKIVEDICDTEENLKMGAVVICSFDSGEILACVSRPAYDRKNVAQYLDSQNGELINRAFSGYTPGSVFKIAVCAAALEENPDFKDTLYECTGKISVSGKEISCHKKDGHGEITMKEAFAQSCNPYFINMGLKVGIEKTLYYAKLLGIRGYDNINLLKTSASKLPQKNLHLPALVANTSIGQGEILCTPLEICSLLRTSVTGNFKKPKLIKSTSDCDTQIPTLEHTEKNVLSYETAEIIRDMMLECVKSGTGKKAESEIVTSAGKTATAQSGQKKDGKEILHSWFAGFFPYEAPKYAVCVMCDGNAKNKSAAEIFKKISEALS